jgi:hypothetical protein
MDNNALAKSNMRTAITAILILEGLPLHFLLSRVHPLLAWGVTLTNVLSLIWLWWPRASPKQPRDA